MTPGNFSFVVTLAAFFSAGLLYFLVLVQLISFLFGFLVMGLATFLIFWRGLLASRHSGELQGLKTKNQILIVSLVATLGFEEVFWSISFLPFSFFILSGIYAVIFAVAFDIFKEYFKNQKNLFFELELKEFMDTLKRDVIMGAAFITILILISPWLPIRN